MFSVNYTDEEARALVALIDLAVKSGGLQVAETAAVLVNKMKAAAAATPSLSGAPTPVAEAAVEVKEAA